MCAVFFERDTDELRQVIYTDQGPRRAGLLFSAVRLSIHPLSVPGRISKAPVARRREYLDWIISWRLI